MRGGYGLSPSIMATNHQIHDEVAAVLYGRNRFNWNDLWRLLRSYQASFHWHRHDNLRLQAKNTRHITIIHFEVNFKGDADSLFPVGIRRGFGMTRDNLHRCREALVPNRLRGVKVTYFDCYAGLLDGCNRG